MIQNLENMAVVAHEFRTPINVISSTAQLVIKANQLDKLSSEKLDEYMLSIKHYCNKLELLTTNILDILKNDNYNIKCDYSTLNVIEFTNNFVNRLMPYAQKFNFILINDINVTEPSFTCDYIKLERILLNLITNAVKYNNKSLKQVHIKVSDTSDHVIFSVKDNGIGIPNNLIGRVTEKFFRVDSFSTCKAEGCGLGLSIVLNFLEALEGKLNIKSILGKGSEFIIHLPKNVKLSSKVNEPHVQFESLSNQIEIEFSSLL